MKRPQKLAVMLVPTPPYEICGLGGSPRAWEPGNDEEYWLNQTPTLQVTESLPKLAVPAAICAHLPMNLLARWITGALIILGTILPGSSQEQVQVEGQPLAANVLRLMKALDYLGTPLDVKLAEALSEAAGNRHAMRLQDLLDPHVLVAVSLNPEVRVKVRRGAAPALLQQHGFSPVIVKVVNNSTVTRQLTITSPQAGPPYAGAAEGILKRQAQTELNDNENTAGADRFLQVEMFHDSPMTTNLSGLEVEYAIALLYSSESGKREATLAFNVGTGTQDLGFRGEVPVLFHIAPALPVHLRVLDHDRAPTVARITARDHTGRVYPPQARRIAPDFFFQPQIYRGDGETILLPPGKFTLSYNRGPEYATKQIEINVSEDGGNNATLELERWIDPETFGFYCGDHHIHGAGCSHYTHPTQGVTPANMFRQVKGEGLNVGCVLTWGPCFDHQRQFFGPVADDLSEPKTVLKYDLEISGFGSAALGHVCLLNLTDQTYPGSDGSKEKGWPTWTVPVMRWCKEQGGYTGYPHSAMHVNPEASAKRFLERFDANADQSLAIDETENVLLPEAFDRIDADSDGAANEDELRQSIERAANTLPNLAVPEMNGAGAMEICVSAAEGVCDFVSAMDTERLPEWNTWYHLLNCGLPIKLSGETDFPCMSSRRVGQGRSYAQLGKQDKVDFHQWCKALAEGSSYVSDGFAHALKFEVSGVAPGPNVVSLGNPGKVQITASVAFAPVQPKAVAYGGIVPSGGRRVIGDTRVLHAPRTEETVEGGTRTVEIVVNGAVAHSFKIPADGKVHPISCDVDVTQSSWIALRQFPQLHTNPVNILIGENPIRASHDSALWCIEVIELLWKNRNHVIAEYEREAARAAYDRAIGFYTEIAKNK
jgi:hypothetical protein